MVRSMSSSNVRAAVEALGKFDVLNEIHEGANSYAFAVNHRDLEEKRFLKVIYLPQEDTASILREPRTLLLALQARPISTNIVRLHDAERIKVQSDEYVLLQMEWLDGSSLQTVLDSKAFGQQDAVRLTMEILQGVAALHRQRLVHRDLKPGNIILQNEIPKIADFGSVSKLANDSQFVHASKHSDLYVPSEGWTDGKYTFSSDLYQVGLVFYQLVNGALPLDGQKYLTTTILKRMREEGKNYSALEAYDRVCAQRQSFAELTAKEKLVDKVSTARPYVSPAIKKIVRRALRADHAKRYTSAEEFLGRLAQVSTPNWQPSDMGFEAMDWRNLNWRVYELKQGKSRQVIVEKSRTNKFRRTLAVTDFATAFEYVEKV